LLLFGCFICGVISAAIASNKNRNALGYFLVCLVLGIIGVIVAAVATPGEPGAALAERSLRRRLRYRVGRIDRVVPQQKPPSAHCQRTDRSSAVGAFIVANPVCVLTASKPFIQ
jgi:hypothetical protein